MKKSLVALLAIAAVLGCGGEESEPEVFVAGPYAGAAILTQDNRAPGDVVEIFMDLSQSEFDLGGTAIFIDPDTLESEAQSLDGSLLGRDVDLTTQKSDMGQVVMVLVQDTGTLVGEMSSTDGKVRAGVDLIPATRNGYDARGAWSGTGTSPGGSGDFELDVTTQTGLVAGGTVGFGELSIPVTFVAVEGSCMRFLPNNLGKFTTKSENGTIMGRLDINANSEGIPAGTYRFDVQRVQS